jgi:hypothetical protein
MSKSSESERPESTKALESAVARMLRPLVALLVQQQIQYPALSHILKRLYLSVASDDFSLRGKRTTLSRLSLLTGIQRRQIKRILSEPETLDAPVPSAIAIGAQIVARWTGAPPWIDARGRPLPLPRKGTDPDVPSFNLLVESISADIHPRSILDEWLRLGVVSLDENDDVVLDSGAFVPVRGFEEKAHFVGRNVRDHLASAGHNLTTEDEPFLERSVYYGSLPPEATRELSELATRLGQESLQAVHQRAHQLKAELTKDEGGPGSERRRITFGVYLYQTPAEENKPPRTSEESDEN